jgi:hypothetical protein
MHPDRIVIGGIDDRSLHVLEELYAGFAGVPLIRTNPSTAEMIKYASNSLLAAMISFSNEIADLCSAVGGIDALDVMRGVHARPTLRCRRQRSAPAGTHRLVPGSRVRLRRKLPAQGRERPGRARKRARPRHGASA